MLEVLYRCISYINLYVAFFIVLGGKKMKKGSMICNKCGKKFIYKNLGDIYAGGKDNEQIICPYCGCVNSYVMTSGYCNI